MASPLSILFEGSVHDFLIQTVTVYPHCLNKISNAVLIHKSSNRKLLERDTSGLQLMSDDISVPIHSIVIDRILTLEPCGSLPILMAEGRVRIVTTIRDQGNAINGRRVIGTFLCKEWLVGPSRCGQTLNPDQGGAMITA